MLHKSIFLTLLVIFLLAKAAICQTAFVKYIPYFLDSKITDVYRDSLKSAGVKPPFITYLTHRHNNEITYFIWTGRDGMNAVEITDSTISQPITNWQQHFMAALKLNVLAIRNTENKLRMIPPINPKTTQTLVMETTSRTYLIQYGSNTNYILDKTMDKDRAAFFRMLLADLLPLQYKWKIKKAYKRYAF